MPERLRLFSGIQPTGVPHLGNYIGAIRRWADLQRRYESFFCVVDLHALTLPWDPRVLRRQSLETAAVLLACGIDPEDALVFRQSQVRQHAELAWILTCLSRMGELRRMVQFKEKSKGEQDSVGVGVLTYPVLQAADVLLYRAHGVPVGEDQRQHIELMRDLAERFNRQLGEVFVVPEAWLPEEGARIMALDNPSEKMSKSSGRAGSLITLTDSPDVIRKKIRAAVTDSGREVVARPDKPALTNLLTIYAAVESISVAEAEERFRGKGYAEFKAALAESVIEALRPVRERYEELMADPGELESLLEKGALRATEIAEATMAEVRERVGLARPPA